MDSSRRPELLRSARRPLAVLSAAAGVTVANLYYAQPLAPAIARSLHASDRAVGGALTFAQIGYALGMLFLVPLGDVRERRGLLVVTAAAAAPALLLVALAPGVAALGAFALLVGVTSCLPQLAVPFAVGLLPVEHRGRALGPVMGGLLTGILVSRTVSGWLGHLVGWRMTFVVAAALMAVLALVLRRALPLQRPPERLSWASGIRSLPALVRDEPLLRRHALVGALGFATFSAIWSTLAFHLASRGHGPEVAGMFGLFGAAGVLAAPLVGRLSGRVPARVVNAAGLGLALLGCAILWRWPDSLARLGVGVAVLDAGVQASHLGNQGVIFGLRPEARNRLNAIYMVVYFLGGALGTALGAWGWGEARWTGVCAVAAAGSAAAIVSLLVMPGARAVAAPSPAAADLDSRSP